MSASGTGLKFRFFDVLVLLEVSTGASKYLEAFFSLEIVEEYIFFSLEGSLLLFDLKAPTICLIAKIGFFPSSFFNPNLLDLLFS